MSDITAIFLFVAFTVVVLLVGFAMKKAELERIEQERYADEVRARRLVTETELKRKTSTAGSSGKARPLDTISKKQTRFDDNKIGRNDGITATPFLCRKIPLMLDGLGQITGNFAVKDPYSGEYFDVDLDHQTCTCARFNGKSRFPKNHMGRFCTHLFAEIFNQGALTGLNHLVYTTLALGTREEIEAAYTLKHPDLPLMYLIVGKDEDWINLYARAKETKQSIYQASGDFERFGWSCREQRWSYGYSPAGASLLNEFLKLVNEPEDLKKIATDFRDEREDNQRKLSELSDPRKNPNEQSEKYGPENDAWEIPNSLLTDSIPLRISLNFRYLDSKEQESRRTVDLKEIQFYGTEGEYIYGECRMRHAGRTFKTSRMWDVTDTETGEVVEDVTSYLKASYEESAVARLRNWMIENERIAKAWLYLLKANKKPTKKEYDVLKAAFSQILGGSPVSTKDIQDLFDGIKVTTPVGFQRLVSGISKHHKDFGSSFALTCSQLVKAKKDPNFADEAALKFVLEKIPSDDLGKNVL